MTNYFEKFLPCRFLEVSSLNIGNNFLKKSITNLLTADYERVIKKVSIKFQPLCVIRDLVNNTIKFQG